jgi:DNA-binding LytR/AlgR family response regulator
MLNIAVCDDQLDQLANIALYIQEYVERNGIDAIVTPYEHPDELLLACETMRFHIYILDIVMPMVNGIEAGRAIRRLDREAQIIYATTEPSFALEAFGVNPMNYLIKPIEKSKLFETLDLAISNVDTKEESIVTIKTKEGIHVVKLSDIIYCEYVKHTVVYRLMGGEVLVTRTIKESFAEHVSTLLSDVRFLQPHTSYVLNMSRIEGFSKEGFVMHGGAVIPIPAKQYASSRDIYMDYLLAREGGK